MTRACCLPCGLRFSPEMVRERRACPFCAEPLTHASAQQALGLRLVGMSRLAIDDPAAERAVELSLMTERIEPS
jgi:hypothetical protein